ncbi:MAG: FtsX-like permease family protein [Myxococcota bacterium]
MLSPRRAKLWGDAKAEAGRVALMLGAIAVSLVAIGTVLGAGSILRVRIRDSYLGTAPASATLELEDGIDPALLAEVRARPDVEAADTREVVLARVKVGEAWRPLLLFGVERFDALVLNRFTPERGAWPPPLGTVLLERSALGMAGRDLGDTMLIKTPHGPPRTTVIRGLVHDPGLAPAWQEREVYAYASLETLRAWGEDGRAHELRVQTRPAPRTTAEAEIAGETIARALAEAGHPVHQIRVPPLGLHPHQRQMTTILVLLSAFAVLALILASVLVATSIQALLARQIREIGVMKTLGAPSQALFRLYLSLVAILGALAAGLASPLALLGARAFAGEVGRMLNFEVAGASVSPWVLVVIFGAGILLPTLAAAVPVRAALRISVREALDAHGAVLIQGVPQGLPVPLRNLLRRPRRTVFTVALLATGGALFMTALAVSGAWQRNLDKIYETRHYDLELRLTEAPAPPLLAAPALVGAEWWGYAPAAFARPGHIDLVRTYPDRGHGSLVMLGPPPGTRLIDFPLLEGRWLEEGDASGVVLNHVAAAQAGGVHAGATVSISVEGAARPMVVRGIVEEIGAAGVIYLGRSEFIAAYGPPKMARFATGATGSGAQAAIIARLESALAEAEAPIEVLIPFTELRTAVGDHVRILIQALVALAVILAIVGLLGLGSALGTAVIERTREIGIQKAIGARPRRIMQGFVLEGLLTAALSWLLAVALSFPLSLAMESLLGQLGFLAPLPFVVSPAAMLGWLGLVLLASVVATLPPARMAARISVRAALDAI